MQDNWKKNTKSYEEYENKMQEIAAGAPSVDEILAEFDKGDYSSIGLDTMTSEEITELKVAIKRGDELAKKSGLSKKQDYINEKDITV